MVQLNLTLEVFLIVVVDEERDLERQEETTKSIMYSIDAEVEVMDKEFKELKAHAMDLMNRYKAVMDYLDYVTDALIDIRSKIEEVKKTL